MNWDMIGALGEWVGAAAVVVTLFYLAHQVREASLEARRQRYGDLHDEISRVTQSWAENSDLSNIVFRGFTTPEALSPEDTFRFYANLYPWFRAWEALFEYSKAGRLEHWRADGTQVLMHDFLGFPGVKRCWADRRHWYSPAFRAEVDKALASAVPTMAKAYHRQGGTGAPGSAQTEGSA